VPRTSAADLRRIEWLLFAAAFAAFAWFHQGGGWNQNARFALVRAIVEARTFAVDDFLVYAPDPSGSGPRLVRLRVRDARFELGGRTHALAWRGPDGQPMRLDGASRSDEVVLVEPAQVAATGDLSFHGGHFHPAKAPGGALVAVPAYASLRAVESLTRVDPDGWWALTVNAWLATALSVGLLAATGCVLLFRLALELSGGRLVASLATAVTFAFGTAFFPYATSLYEHDVIAVALLASFWLSFRAREPGRGDASPPTTSGSPAPTTRGGLASGEPPPAAGSPDSAAPLAPGRARAYLAAAGLCAGFGAITNYVVAAVVLFLGAYVVLAVRRRGGWRWYALGVAGPFLLICAYNLACFGTPFTTNYRHEDPAFKAAGAFLDVFVWPGWEVLPALLLSPFRGLFVGAPVLLLGAWGLFAWVRSGRLRAEAWLFLSILGFFLLVVTTFNGWHGGWAVGPRYLAPALPFLAAPAVLGFVRFPGTTGVLAAVSVALNLLVTAVDPQAPVGVAGHARVEGRSLWLHSPLTEYVIPLFATGRAFPLLESQREAVLRFLDAALASDGVPPAARAEGVAALRRQIDAAIAAGEPALLLATRGPDGRPGLVRSELPTVVGPVSANPVGVYEGWMYRVFPSGSPEARMNSFNAGELLFPGSRWSLAPLLAVEALLLAVAFRRASRLAAG